MIFKKIYVEITNKCNRNCKFCSKDILEKKEMDIEHFNIVIDKIRKYTNYIYLHVKGEPLSHSNFSKILDICEEKNIKVNITTNGFYLKKYYNKIIKSKAVRQINISLHAYDIKEEEKIYEIVETAKNISLNSNIYIQFRLWLYNKNDKNNNIYFNIINKIFNLKTDTLEKLYYEDNIKINDTTFLNKDKEFIWPNLDNKFYSNSGTCYGTRSHIAILSNGTVVPCCLDSNGVINLGNIFNSNLEEIVNSEKFIKINNGFKNNKKEEELCKHCDFI